MEEQIRRATHVITSYAADPTSFDAEVYNAARQFLDSAIRTGGSEQ
jgi:hypothetical protein